MYIYCISWSWKQVIMELRGKRPVQPLRFVNFTNWKLFFRPVERLKLFGGLFPYRSANVFSVLREISTVVITIIWIVCFEAVPRALLSRFKQSIKCADVSAVALVNILLSLADNLDVGKRLLITQTEKNWIHPIQQLGNSDNMDL